METAPSYDTSVASDAESMDVSSDYSFDESGMQEMLDLEAMYALPDATSGELSMGAEPAATDESSLSASDQAEIDDLEAAFSLPDATPGTLAMAEPAPLQEAFDLPDEPTEAAAEPANEDVVDEPSDYSVGEALDNILTEVPDDAAIEQTESEPDPTPDPLGQTALHTLVELTPPEPEAETLAEAELINDTIETPLITSDAIPEVGQAYHRELETAARYQEAHSDTQAAQREQATTGHILYDSTELPAGVNEQPNPDAMFDGLLATYNLKVQDTSILTTEHMVDGQPITSTIRYAQVEPQMWLVERVDAEAASGAAMAQIAAVSSLRDYLQFALPQELPEEEIIDVNHIGDEATYTINMDKPDVPDGRMLAGDIRTALNREFNGTPWEAEIKEGGGTIERTDVDHGEVVGSRFNGEVSRKVHHAVDSVRLDDNKPTVDESGLLH